MRKYYVHWLNNCQGCELAYTCNDAEDTEIDAWRASRGYGNDEIAFRQITREEALYLARCHDTLIFPWHARRDPFFWSSVPSYDFDWLKLEDEYIVNYVK